MILGVIAWLRPAPSAPSAAAPAAVGYAQLKLVLEQRCYACHGEAVRMKNLRLDSPGQVAAHAQQIYQQVVLLKAMPFNNATQITPEERDTLGRWFTAGAPLK